jgi:thiamine biosynthesis lipoprotein
LEQENVMLKLSRTPRIVVHAAVLGLLSVLLLSCAPVADTTPWSRSAPVFGEIPFTLTLYGEVDETLFDAALADLTTLDEELSMWERPYVTDVMRLHDAAGIKAVQVSADTMAVIRRGIEVAKDTGGALDIAIGPLVKAWGIATDHPREPAPSEIAALLPISHWQDIEVGTESVGQPGTVKLAKAGMVVDLGGIAKGYAADLVADTLRTKGVKSAIIDIGGNILVMGSKPDGKPFRIGIQDPLAEARGTYLGIANIINQSLVTSGTYERRFTDAKTGKTWHHILNPATGYPAENELDSVSIIGDKSIDCDAYAKVFVMGLKKGWAFVLTHPELQAIFITTDKRVFVTPGLASRFTLTNKDYKLEDQP